MSICGKKIVYPFRVENMDYCNGPFENYITSLGQLVGLGAGIYIGCEAVDFVKELAQPGVIEHLVSEFPRTTIVVSGFTGFKIGRNISDYVGSVLDRIFKTSPP